MECAAGSFSNTTHAIVCSPCAAGTYNSYVGVSQCMSCPAGTYGDVAGATVCQNCRPGTYSSPSQATVCSLCSIGFSSTERASSCTICAAGKYSALTSLLDFVFTCVECPEDTYSATLGATNESVCVQCTSGKYSQKGTFADSACITCGFYPNCAAGCYSIEKIQSTQSSIQMLNESDIASSYEVLFPNGSWVRQQNTLPNATRILTCHECDRGKFSTSGNVSMCTACAMGEYQNQLVATACHNCQSDSWTLLPERQDISDCRCNAGFTLTAGNVCEKCPMGKFKPSIGNEPCLSCIWGSWTLDVGSTAVTQCLCDIG